MGKLSLTIIVALFLAVVGYLSASVAYPPPRLLIENPVFDFGEADVHSELSHVFVLKNTGGRPLKIENIKSNCTCTKAEVSATILRPDQSTELAVHLRVKNSTVPLLGRITISTNDPDAPSMDVKVQVRAKIGLQVSPTFVDFGSLETANISEMPFELTVLTAADDAFSVKLSDVFGEPTIQATIDRTEDRPRISLSLSPMTPIGPLTAVVTVSHEDMDVPDLTLPVRGEVVGPVRFLPKTAYLGLLEDDDDLMQRVEIVAANGDRSYSSRVVSVSSSLDGILEARMVIDGGRQFVEIQVSPTVFTAQRTEFSGAVIVRCEGDIEATMKLPVRFFVLSQSA